MGKTHVSSETSWKYKEHKKDFFYGKAFSKKVYPISSKSRYGRLSDSSKYYRKSAE